MRRRLALALGILGLAAASPAAAAAAAPPGGLTGMALDGRVELAWQPAAGATGYRVYRGTAANAINTPLMASPLTPVDLNAPVSFVDVGAVDGTTYFYAVRSIEGGVESASSRATRATPRAASCNGGNPVTRENCRPGATDWDVAQGTGVRAFGTAQSIDQLGSVGLKVSAPGASTVDVEIFRSGHYGGTGARLFSAVDGVPVAAQPACVADSGTGLRDCSNWSVMHTVSTTASWPSGVYLIRITRPDTGADTHVLLVVRDDDRGADLLFGIPTTTYQAYNNYGGKSLYNHNSTGANTVAGSARAVKASFDRPYEQQHDGIAHDWYTRTDFSTVRWLERSGYDVSYAAVSDLERSGTMVRQHRAFISGAHDEYYSLAMRTALEQAREQGTDLFVTGANGIYWRVRFEPSPVGGGQDRVLVSYKSTQSGGPDPSGIPTGTWRDPAGANAPENALTGVMYVGQKDFTYYPMTVTAAQGRDRIWRYTGLDTQPTGGSTNIGSGLLGWEWDARVDNGRQPAGLVTLAASVGNGDILQDAGRTYAPGSAVSHMTKYQWPSGSLVVATGTNQWNWGLARDARGLGEPDSRIQQATTNILVDMGALPETPAGGIVLDDPAAPPLVTQRDPAAGATDINPAAPVRATFSRPMDASTLTTANIRLERPDGTAVPAAVSYDTVTFAATLTPSSPLALDTTHTVRLAATVRAANGVALGSPVSWSFTTRPPDTTPPAVAVTSPADGSTVVASADLRANATDAGGVAGVRFRVDGSDLGAEDTAAPYELPWDVRNVSAGTHAITAVARDTSGNTATSAPVTVTVDPKGLVGAYGFEETAGTAATDSSGRANAGTIFGATRSTSGRFGRALSFDGVDDVVNVADSATLDLTTGMTLEAWVRPTATGGWRTAVFKEQSGGLVYALYANTDSNRPSAHVHTISEVDTRGTAQVPLNGWTHLAATYDSANLRLFVNGAQVSSRAVTGNVVTSTGALRIGGNTVWGERFAGLIDEVRVYRRALTAAEVQADMNLAIVAPDAQPPTAPGNLAATGGVGRVALTWSASSDDVGVARYNVHRSATAGFTPTTANRVAQVTGVAYDDAVAAGTWFYRVVAEDGAANPSAPSGEASATATSDTAAPTVGLGAPAAGATLQGTVNVTATASDNVGVAGVQFRLDGADLGVEDTSAPYATSWDTRTAANGPHALTAIARDAAGNRTTATTVSVNVDNPPVDTSGLVAAYGFEEAAGDTVTDSSTQSNAGTIAGATRTASGRFGAALTFDGVDDWVTAADADTFDLSTAMTLEAWVRPTTSSGWKTAFVKERASGLSYGLYTNTNNNRPSANVQIASEVDTRGTAALPLNTWSHLAATYDGANLRLYVNGTQASSRAVTGAIAIGTGPLRIGGNAFAGDEFFNGLIDEVRVYRRALTSAELQADMGRAIVATDTGAPTAPGGLTAAGGIGRATLSWIAAADDVGVVRYNVHRSATSGFTPSTANRVAQVTGTGHADTGLPAGTWYYRVTAEDAAGHVGAASAQASAVATSDTTAPTVALTAPDAGATVLGTVSVTANAADDVAVAGVQFRLDGADLGGEDTSAPYSVSWDTLSAANGPHALTAIARDGSGNRTTAASRSVSVNNPPVDTSGLVAAFGFEEGGGSTVSDRSTAANHGSVSGAGWSTSGHFGAALSFDGVDDRVTVPDAASLDLSDGMTVGAWVKPSQHAEWRTALLKETGSGLAYALFSSAWNDRPSGHVSTPAELDTRGPATLPTNEWSHLTTTWDGATLRLYVNGALQSSTAVGGAITASTGPLRIGGNAIWGEYFKGLIDEVRVYRRALSATEVQRDMETPVVPGSPPPVGPEVTGQFSPPVDWPLVPVHIATLNNGKIAVWDGFDAALNSERVWDPATGAFDPVPSGRNLFCAAHVTLPDGRLFIAGGHIEANLGLKDTQIFNPANRTWFRGTDMARGRWYPTATTLPDGRILVVSGDNITLNAPGLPVPLKNGAETLPEIYDVDANQWTPLVSGQRRMPLYPFMFVLPDGRVVDAGPDLQTRTLNVTTGQWTNVATSTVDGHSAVMYRPGKILKSGTWADVDYPGIQASARAQTIDFTQANPTWQDTGSMRNGRSYHTLTALPDGTVLATGGGSESDGVDHSKAVFPVELWDPATGQWTELAAHRRARLYHSSALLLQDGRILLAGGGAFATAANESNAEIYSPPYLFKGPRPTITAAPSQMPLGSTIQVTSPEAANVDKVSLVRMGSVTHNFDMDQRFQHLPFTEAANGTLNVDAPTSANVAPPGWYYLFAVSEAGVPSIGRIIQIPEPSGDSQAPTAPGSLTAAVEGGDDVRLTWTAATDNVGVVEYRVHRSATPGFTPSAATRIDTVSGTARSYTDTGRPVGTWYYQVVAADGAGNAGPSSREEAATVAPDSTPPIVSVTAPTAGATVSGGSVTLAANASDDRGLGSVQFKVNGANAGAADSSPPYSVAWDSRTVADGAHSVTAVATDAAGLSATSAAVQVSVDNAPAPDTTPPTAPSNLVGTGSATGVQLTWTAATDAVGVTRYNLHRGTASGFAPSAANRIAQPAGTSHSDTPLAGGTYFYRVTAEDAAGNVSAASAQAQATVDTTAPTVSITAPAAGATISGTVSVTATAADAVGVAGVQFRLDGAPLGGEDTSSPYSWSWNTASATNGSHTLTAVARDAAGNTTVSAAVTVNVSNVAPTGLVAALGFDEASGTTATDSSSTGNAGIISGATRSTAGRFGGALSFDGVNDQVTVADSNSLDLATGMTLEAWVRPTVLGGWRTVLLKERTGGLVYALYSSEDGNRPSVHTFIGASEFDARGTGQVAANAWTHLAATYDGANLRLYVNGTQTSSRALTGAMVVSSGALRIGGNQVWPEWFAGLIDEVRVYNRALGAPEIGADMTRPVTGG